MRCTTPAAACAAVRAGADGTVLLFSPNAAEIEGILSAGAAAAGEVVRQPGERLIGVAALQGDYQLHACNLEAALTRRPGSTPVHVVLVRSPEDFDALDALVLPGGWSNLQTRLMRRRGVDAQVRALHLRGTPILGVCAGMVLARSRDGAGCEDRLALGLVDATVANNVVHGWHDVHFPGGGCERLREAQAPVVVERGPAVRVLATLADGTVVGAGQDRVQVFAFHEGIHEAFLDLCLACWRQS